MANSVSKDDVKWFVKQVVLEWDKRNLAKFAPTPSVNSVKSDLELLESEVANINTDTFVEKVDGKGLSSNDFTNEHKTLLENLAKENNSTFDAADVLDIFD
ncbi:MAG: hypothetical protein IKN16_11835 [Selenomonadaceae bacterium]|nr:hypothetical protein [Selenomonadaceae bacterium]